MFIWIFRGEGGLNLVCLAFYSYSLDAENSLLGFSLVGRGFGRPGRLRIVVWAGGMKKKI